MVRREREPELTPETPLAVRHDESCLWARGGEGFRCTCGAWKRELRAGGAPVIELARSRTLRQRIMRHLFGGRR